MRTKEQVLKESKTIAVVGISSDSGRASYGVARYLQSQGYRIIPVNPTVKGKVLGEQVYPSLKDVPVPVDIVDVFRRSELVMPIAEEAVAIKAKALWMQDGIVNEEAAKVARDAGLDVVMDDCAMRRHSRLKASGKL